MSPHHTPLHPCFDPAETSNELSRLLVSGPIVDADLDRRIARLRERFRIYCGIYPFGMWDSGLVVTREMRALTDLLLPLTEILPAFSRLFRLTLRFPPLLEATPLTTACSWLDLLERLDVSAARGNPARLLEQLAGDGARRTSFVFSLFIPRHYGGGFDRYPDQTAFLKRWIRQRGTPEGGIFSVLDAACGCGEGTYALARLLMGMGVAPDRFRVLGSSLEEIELFAARHAFFPHDQRRGEVLRSFAAPLLAAGAATSIGFVREDIREATGGAWDVILCNGILGGPFIHDRQTLERTIARLAARLAPGGLIVAADRFHEGWKRRVPAAMLEEMLRGAGLTVLTVGEGVAGVRP
ncbi:chemotaxis protein CheR [Geobacter sulfurreducens]|uniref:class I SAM-dependent methyltransferase n=1 Tax=Geobacter sulfurreducens TaxID=35554 RepID=UPI001BDD0CF8|nr:CheR family methyltransferase [Geobacter sulfurreducens]QVW35558.1 chemotaxis protein CheR [Geobacter sulfurreducens]